MFLSAEKHKKDGHKEEDHLCQRQSTLLCCLLLIMEASSCCMPRLGYVNCLMFFNRQTHKHSNEDLHRGRPKLSSKIAARRMRLAGHCHKHKKLPVGTLVLWEPMPGQGHRSQGKAEDGHRY